MPLYFPPAAGSGGGISGIAINGTSFSSWTDGYIHAQDNRLSIYDNLTNVMYFDDDKLLQRIYMSTLGNTSGSTGFAINRLVFVGGSNVTLEGAWSEANTSAAYSKASGTITIHAGGGNTFLAGISTGGATTGSTGTVSGQVIFYAASNIVLNGSIDGNSMSIGIIGRNWMDGIFDESGSTTGNYVSGVQVLSFQNSNGISFSVSGAGNYGKVKASYNPFNAGVSSGGNTAGTSGTNTGQLLLYGGSNITLSQSTGTGGNTVTIVGASGGTGGGVQATIPCVWLGNIMDATADTLKNGSYWVQSTMIPGYMELAKIGVGLLGANNSSQFTLSMSLRFQLFTKNGSTLSPFTSGSTLITQVMYNSTDANFSLIYGMRFAECPLSYTFSTGGAIYIGMNISTTRSGANLSPRNLMVIGPNYSNFGWRFGEAGAHLIFPGYGTYSVTTNGTLASIAITAIGFQTSANTWRSQPLIYLSNSENWP